MWQPDRRLPTLRQASAVPCRYGPRASGRRAPRQPRRLGAGAGGRGHPARAGHRHPCLRPRLEVKGRGDGTAAAAELVTDGKDLERLIERLVGRDRYALDTEFHRERTYWPQLALVQVAWTDADGSPGVALIDPLAVDMAPLARLLDSPALMVAHAAEQDLEVLERACGTAPRRLLDTQVAAGFLGRGSASLATLVSAYLRVRLPKADRLTDWSARPLTSGQQSYAAADVAHLLDLADAICDALRAAGRLGWAEEECDTLLHRQGGPDEVERAWWKLRDSRQLRGSARGVAQEVAAWRERRAREVDQPARFVLPDLAVQAIAHGQPATVAAVRQTRGLDGRHLRGSQALEVLAAIDRGRRLAEECLRLPPPTRSTGTCGPPSPWPPPGSHSWLGTRASTPPCWRQGATWSGSSGTTARHASGGVGGGRWWASLWPGCCTATPPWPSTVGGGWCSRPGHTGPSPPAPAPAERRPDQHPPPRRLSRRRAWGGGRCAG